MSWLKGDCARESVKVYIWCPFVGVDGWSSISTASEIPPSKGTPHFMSLHRADRFGTCRHPHSDNGSV